MKNWTNVQHGMCVVIVLALRESTHFREDMRQSEFPILLQWP